MSKERLEEIGKRTKHRVLENSRGEVRYRFTEINTEDFDWLIEQAERVQELGKLSDNLRHELFSVRIERDLLKEEVKALKKSVDFLEKQRERMGNNHQQTIKDAELLLKQNKHYKQALEFYADEENYKPFDGIFLSNYQNKVDEDGGEIARKALEGEEK